ncbi:PDR/VanB family oxidoreductase [Paracoccus aminophilus]|uniref:Vanillate monooxygenase n=1 Tax=Paracoccus aminophilus JCM 7686 TaxID=1367847 RepID=S5Y084_PARAH|nr:PDR/VanB family oxidoreductase [Paracoccus aminophilus]AGT10952.1 vanillate monooxygenase [Paracoccus aminophilus JCM 7686]
MELIVSALRINGDDNLDIELMAPDGAALPPYAPGAHIDLRTPSGMLRQYSLCGRAEEERRYLVCVRQDATSRGGSRSLHRELRVRDRVEVSQPRNLFPLPEAGRYILFSAGIGITPIMAMARRLMAGGADLEWHHYERSRARVAFLDELTTPPFGAVVKLHLDEEGANILAGTPDCLSAPDADAVVLACGPGPFLDLLAGRMAEAGWQDGQFHSERFQPLPLAVPEGTEAASFEVRLASSGQSFAIGAEESIASVLQRHGIAVDLSCEQGMCGACLTRVLEGTPDHRDIVLSAAEQEAGDQMTICCSRAKTPLLVLDL